MATEPLAAPAKQVIKIVLAGLAEGLYLDDLIPQVGAFVSDRSLLPGDIILDLAADIIAI